MDNGILEIPHPDKQPNFFELREEFRATNLARILSSLRAKRQGVGPLTYSYLTDGKGLPTNVTLDDNDGSFIFNERANDYGLTAVLANEVKELEERALNAYMFEAMVLPEGEGVDHDAPPLRYPIENCSDEDLLYYLDQAVGEMEANESRKDDSK